MLAALLSLLAYILKFRCSSRGRNRNIFVSTQTPSTGLLLPTSFWSRLQRGSPKQRLYVVSSIQLGLSPWLVKVSQKMWVMIRVQGGVNNAGAYKAAKSCVQGATTSAILPHLCTSCLVYAVRRQLHERGQEVFR